MIDLEFNDISYEELVKMTLKEASLFEKTKKKRIIILAKKLENGGSPKDMISQKITRDLEGWVNPKYVRDCLGEAYKNPKLVREQSTGQRRGSTPAGDDKNVLVAITNEWKQESVNEDPVTRKAVQPFRRVDSPLPRDETTSIESLQDKQKVTEQERDYFADKLAEKSPEFSELYERKRQLEEIEKERIKHNNFHSAASLSAKTELQTKIETLEKRASEQVALLAETRFEADLELPDQSLPVIIIINRSATKASVTLNRAKMKRY